MWKKWSAFCILCTFICTAPSFELQMWSLLWCVFVIPIKTKLVTEAKQPPAINDRIVQLQNTEKVHQQEDCTTGKVKRKDESHSTGDVICSCLPRYVGGIEYEMLWMLRSHYARGPLPAFRSTDANCEKTNLFWCVLHSLPCAELTCVPLSRWALSTKYL